MTRAQAQILHKITVRMLELSASVHRLATVDARLLEAEFTAETLSAVSHDLRTLAKAVGELIVADFNGSEKK